MCTVCSGVTVLITQAKHRTEEIMHVEPDLLVLCASTSQKVKQMDFLTVVAAFKIANT